MVLSEEDERTVYYVRLGCNVASLLGSLFIIVVYFSFAKLREQKSFRLVLYLSISDFFYCTALFLGVDAESNLGLCLFQAIIISFFSLATVLWTVAISSSAYLEIHRKEPISEVRWLALIFGTCGLLTVLPFSTDSYGEHVEWCWVDTAGSTAAGITWQLVQFYIPLWFAFCINTYCVISFYYTHRATVRSLVGITDRQFDDQMSKVRPMLLYPSVLLVCGAAATIDQLYNYARTPGETSSFVLAILHYGLGTLQGLGNAVVYGLNDEVKHELTAAFARRKESLLTPQ